MLGLRALAEGLGVRNLDWRASRQRAASFGPGGTPAQLEAAQTILELGNSLAGTAPVLDLRVRKALLHHGARLVSVGSVGASGGRSGVPSELAASVDEISASAFAVERLALVWDGEDPALAAAALARCEAAGVVSCATYVAGEVPNARGAEAFGIVPPAGGLGVRAQLEAAAGGELDVLLIVGANPLLRFPDRALVLRALERAPFVVASELFLTESAAHASLVLPVKSAFEKDGHTANCSGEVLPVRAALAAPEGPLSDLEIFVALAAELGLAFPAPSELSRRAATFPLNGAPLEPATAAPNSANAAARAAEQAPPSARLRLVVMQDIFSGGGTSANDVPVAGLRATPSVTLGPVSARAAGVVAGDRVDLVCDAGRLADLVVVVDERLGEGLARIVDGLPDGPANALGELVRIENVRRASAAQEAALIGGLR